MRKLFFQQITDSRFDSNCKELLEIRLNKLKDIFKNKENIELYIGDIYKVEFDNNYQYRANVMIVKNTRKYAWNDIYGFVNSVNATKYTFIY